MAGYLSCSSISRHRSAWFCSLRLQIFSAFQLPDALLLPVLPADLAHRNAGGFQPAAQRVDAYPQLFGHFHWLTALFCDQPHGSGFECIVVPWGAVRFFVFFCSIARAPLLSSLRLFFLSVNSGMGHLLCVYIAGAQHHYQQVGIH